MTTTVDTGNLTTSHLGKAVRVIRAGSTITGPLESFTHQYTEEQSFCAPYPDRMLIGTELQIGGWTTEIRGCTRLELLEEDTK